jgi:hypothetical protein
MDAPINELTEVIIAQLTDANPGTIYVQGQRIDFDLHPMHGIHTVHKVNKNDGKLCHLHKIEVLPTLKALRILIQRKSIYRASLYTVEEKPGIDFFGSFKEQDFVIRAAEHEEFDEVLKYFTEYFGNHYYPKDHWLRLFQEKKKKEATVPPQRKEVKKQNKYKRPKPLWRKNLFFGS